MKKAIVCSALVCFVVFAGCASASKKPTMSGLNEKVDALERQVRVLQEENSQMQKSLREQQSLSKQLGKQSVTARKAEQFVAPSNKDIQAALKNAGFYSGEVDGKIGPQTRNAVMKFQEENDLKVDGIVGRSTWELLEQHL